MSWKSHENRWNINRTHRYIKQSANVPLDGYWVKQCKEVFSLLTGWVTCCSQTSDDQHQEHSSTYTSSVCTWSPSNQNHVQLFVSLSTGKASVASATPSSSEPTSFLFVLTSEKATTNQNYCLWSKNKVVIFVKYSANKFWLNIWQQNLTEPFSLFANYFCIF